MMIDKETKDELEALATLERTSMAKLTREFIKEGIVRRKKKKEVKKKGKLNLGEFILKLAKEAKKHKGSGVGDLAQNHDHYLYGEGRIK
jgi:hypothetical protein